MNIVIELTPKEVETLRESYLAEVGPGNGSMSDFNVFIKENILGRYDAEVVVVNDEAQTLYKLGE